MIITIIGPMTGHPGYNADLFDAVELELSSQGHTVFNPANNIPIVNPESVPHYHYLKISFAMIDCSDAVCMLFGWEKSPGAMLEYEYARKHGKGAFERV